MSNQPLQGTTFRKAHTRKRVNVQLELSKEVDDLKMSIPAVQNGKRTIRSLDHKRVASKVPIYSVRWSARRLWTTDVAGALISWTVDPIKFAEIVQPPKKVIAPSVRALTLSSDEKFIVTGNQNGEIKYYDQTMHYLKCIKVHEESIRDLVFAPSDELLLTASDDQLLHVTDFRTGRCLSTLKGHGWIVNSCDWHPTYKLAVSGDKLGRVCLWDPMNSKPVLKLTNHTASSNCVRFSGFLLGSCSNDHSIRVWDIRKMSKELRSYRDHRAPVTTFAWAKDSEHIGSADIYGNVHLSLDTHTIAKNKAHRGQVNSISWSVYGDYLATVGRDQTLQVLSTSE